jgi:hypothetical protein
MNGIVNWKSLKVEVENKALHDLQEVSWGMNCSLAPVPFRDLELPIVSAPAPSFRARPRRAVAGKTPAHEILEKCVGHAQGKCKTALRYSSFVVERSRLLQLRSGCKRKIWEDGVAREDLGTGSEIRDLARPSGICMMPGGSSHFFEGQSNIQERRIAARSPSITLVRHLKSNAARPWQQE